MLTGCFTAGSSQPEDLERMKDVFTEIYYVRAAFETLPSSVRDSMLNRYKSEVLRKHGMSDSVFEQRIRFYSSDPVAMEALERKVRDELVARIAADSLLLARATATKDSVN